MNENEKITMIADTLNTEAALVPETVLDTLDEWDSMGQISLIAMLNKKFDILLNVEQIAAMKTVRDILDKMQ